MLEDTALPLASEGGESHVAGHASPPGSEGGESHCSVKLRGAFRDNQSHDITRQQCLLERGHGDNAFSTRRFRFDPAIASCVKKTMEG
jgi:hypothetical protein